MVHVAGTQISAQFISSQMLPINDGVAQEFWQ